MDFDFAKILFILVAVTGLIWVLDFFWLKKKRDEDAPTPFYVEWGASFFPILAFVFILRGFLYEPFQIPSGSMIPTLKVGDFILVNKYSYGVRLPIIGTKIIPVDDPERGDVAVFIPPHDDRYFIKRVIGLPGDRIRVENNQVWVNDEALPQEFVASIGYFGQSARLLEETAGEVVHQIQTTESVSGRDMREILVKQGHYFMMGDNRNNSEDSRVWGLVPNENLVGQAKFVWMHWESWRQIPSFSDARSIK